MHGNLRKTCRKCKVHWRSFKLHDPRDQGDGFSHFMRYHSLNITTQGCIESKEIFINDFLQFLAEVSSSLY